MEADEGIIAVKKEDMAFKFQTPNTSFAGDPGPRQLGDGVAPPEGHTARHEMLSSPPSDSPGYSIAKLSFMPATQTTVVTTTTTTTFDCPPLVMKEPHALRDLDPKVYPLASSPTPALIKKFDFELAGQRAAFQEADDPAATSRQLSQQQHELIENNGALRSFKRLKTDSKGPESWIHSTSKLSSPPSSSRQLTSSPSTVTEAGRIQTPQPLRRQLSRSQSNLGRSSRLQVMQTSTPITPSLVDNDEDPIRNVGRPTEVASPVPRNRDEAGLRLNLPDAMQIDQTDDQVVIHGRLHGSDSATGATSPSSRLRRPLPHDTTQGTDASLPSPSLSPVTAAASIGLKRGYFDHSETLLNRSPPNETIDEMADTQALSSHLSEDPMALSISQLSQNQTQLQQGTTPSLMDVPRMVETFDALPYSFKSYVMFQFLRRCEKPVLQFVADNVNPALKCDFVSLLPNELTQQILSLLDTRSLCRAAQVSKKWRSIIDGSEKTWKDLMHKSGYFVAPSELRRAILEGWGWQYGSRVPHEDWEKDIGLRNIPELASPLLQEQGAALEDDMNLDDLPQDHGSGNLSPRRASKRKTTAKGRATSRKLQKRRDSKAQASPSFDTAGLVKHLAATDGPFAVARVANLAVPNPTASETGLPSIRSMHLYKSLYRRQHQIDAAWMHAHPKPRHLAFKAHERHVVTCLHFDSERILTGSDDTNINVYDTKTGVQRTTLTGHDGGVWALKCYGNTLVSGSTDRTVRVWDIEAGECTHVFHGHTSTVRCLVILLPTVVGRHSDGRPIVTPREPLIITGSRDSNLRIWKLPQPRHRDMTNGMSPEEVENFYFVRALTGHTHSVRAIAAHGDTLVSGSYDHTVRVWSVSTGEQLHTLRGHNQKVYSVVLDTNRNRCISGSMDNTVKIWSLADGSLIHNLEGHSSLVGLLDLQGDRLVSAAADSTLRIWDPESGHCKATLLAHTGAITCFQHDAQKVISGSDRTMKMWDTKTGEFVRDLLTDLSGVWQVGFDGRRCVAAVQREALTYIEVLDFGAARDGVPENKRGIRIEVDQDGEEVAPPPTLEERHAMYMALAEVPINMP